MFSNDALPSTHSIAGVEKADLQQAVSLNMGTKVTTMSNPTESQQMVLKPRNLNSNVRITLRDGTSLKTTKPRESSTTHVVNNPVDLAKERRDALKLMRLKNKEFLFKMNRVYQLTDKQCQEFGLKRAKGSVAWTLLDKKKVEIVYSN